MLPAADRVAAIIPAAGSGTRLGADVPKAFIALDGLTLLTRSALAMSRFAGTVVVAAPDGHLERAARELAELDGDVHVVAGGADRQASVAACLHVLPDGIDVVLVHDAARPLVPAAVVQRVLAAIGDGAQAAIPVLPVVDTVREVEGRLAGRVIDRAALRRVQTPQAFRTEVVRQAYTVATRSETDDAAVVQAAGFDVVAVEGDERALKITTPDDMVVARAYLEELR